MNRILIVDDEEAICFAMSEYFTLQGYRVDCAQTVAEAEALIAENRYAAAIVDLRLSGVFDRGGEEVIHLIREQNPVTRVIVLTAYGSEELEREMRGHGADAFLRKPKPLPDVAQVVYGLVGSAM